MRERECVNVNLYLFIIQSVRDTTLNECYQISSIKYLRKYFYCYKKRNISNLCFRKNQILYLCDIKQKKNVSTFSLLPS